MRKPRARIFAMNEPAVTCGGPSGARLAASGLQVAAAPPAPARLTERAAMAGAATAEWTATRAVAVAAGRAPGRAAHPGETAMVITAARATAPGFTSRGRAFIDTPRACGSVPRRSWPP